MAAETLRVRNLQRFQRAVNRAGARTKSTVHGALKEGVRPVVETAKDKESRWGGAKISTIGPRITTRSVFVTQRARKVTGKRPDFGALQMREAFIPALEENEHTVVREVEKALDRLVESSGL